MLNRSTALIDCTFNQRQRARYGRVGINWAISWLCCRELGQGEERPQGQSTASGFQPNSGSVTAADCSVLWWAPCFLIAHASPSQPSNRSENDTDKPEIGPMSQSTPARAFWFPLEILRLGVLGKRPPPSNLWHMYGEHS